FSLEGGATSVEQARLRAAVVPEDTEPWQREPGWAGLQRVGGVDLSYVKGDDGSACASLVVLSYPGLEVPAGRGHEGTLTVTITYFLTLYFLTLSVFMP
uniref:Uncharacterized protein n=1 Tax=Pavo cristatus TaxID=9049 RepID=A0A8C9L864_PAVCR